MTKQDHDQQAPSDEPATADRAPRRLVGTALKVVGILFLAEIVVMHLLRVFGLSEGAWKDAADGLLLAILALPGLYLVGFRGVPLVRPHDLHKYTRAEKRVLYLLTGFVAVVIALILIQAVVATAQESGSAVINVTGRQRMLTQRLTKAASFQAMESVHRRLTGLELPARNDLEEDSARFEHALQALIEGDDGLGLPPCPSEPALRQLKAVQAVWHPFQALLARAGEPVINMDEGYAYSAALNDAGESVLTEMEQAVKLLEAHYTGRAALLQSLYGASLASGALIGLLLIVAFAQMMRLRQRLHGELCRHREHLEEKVTERTHTLRKTNEELRTEIANRERVEHELVASRANFRSIVEKNSEGMMVVDNGGLVRFANPAAEVLLDRPAKELVGTLFGCPLVADEQVEIDIVRYGRDGERGVAEMRLAETDWEGQATHLVMLRDITERIRAERAVKQHAAALEAANEALSEANVAATAAKEALETSVSELSHSNAELDDFAYIASHDLKEPLRGIHNYSTFLLEDYGDKLDGDGRAKLETLARLAQRMDAFIDSLLHYSRLGRLDLAAEETNLEDVVNDALDSLHITLNEAGIEVRRPRALPTIRCDRSRIGEVFRNLITNALKYNDKPEKWIEIGCQQPGQEYGTREAAEGPAVFYVRDNGIGIRRQHMDSIFRIFKRLHGRDKYGGGTGAGLTIAKKIVERHGGCIWVESVYGEGTIFYFTLEHTDDYDHHDRSKCTADSAR